MRNHIQLAKSWAQQCRAAFLSAMILLMQATAGAAAFPFPTDTGFPILTNIEPVDCKLIVNDSDNYVFEFHNGPTSYRDYVAYYYELQKKHWDEGWGWSSHQDPSRAMTKMMNAAFVLRNAIDESPVIWVKQNLPIGLRPGGSSLDVGKPVLETDSSGALWVYVRNGLGELVQYRGLLNDPYEPFSELNVSRAISHGGYEFREDPVVLYHEGSSWVILCPNAVGSAGTLAAPVAPGATLIYEIQSDTPGPSSLWHVRFLAPPEPDPVLGVPSGVPTQMTNVVVTRTVGSGETRYQLSGLHAGTIVSYHLNRLGNTIAAIQLPRPSGSASGLKSLLHGQFDTWNRYHVVGVTYSDELVLYILDTPLSSSPTVARITASTGNSPSPTSACHITTSGRNTVRIYYIDRSSHFVQVTGSRSSESDPFSWRLLDISATTGGRTDITSGPVAIIDSLGLDIFCIAGVANGDLAQFWSGSEDFFHRRSVPAPPDLADNLVVKWSWGEYPTTVYAVDSISMALWRYRLHVGGGSGLADFITNRVDTPNLSSLRHHVPAVAYDKDLQHVIVAVAQVQNGLRRFSQIRARPWHGHEDYKPWASGRLNGFQYRPVSSDIRTAYAYAGWFRRDIVQMYCPCFDTDDARPVLRAGTMLHEATHINFASKWDVWDHDSNDKDRWYHHGVNDYAIGDLEVGDGRTHSMRQIQVEFLADVAEFAAFWVNWSMSDGAKTFANNYIDNRFSNDVGWRVGEPRPL